MNIESLQVFLKLYSSQTIRIFFLRIYPETHQNIWTEVKGHVEQTPKRLFISWWSLLLSRLWNCGWQGNWEIQLCLWKWRRFGQKSVKPRHNWCMLAVWGCCLWFIIVHCTCCTSVIYKISYLKNSLPFLKNKNKTFYHLVWCWWPINDHVFILISSSFLTFNSRWLNVMMIKLTLFFHRWVVSNNVCFSLVIIEQWKMANNTSNTINNPEKKEFLNFNLFINIGGPC